MTLNFQITMSDHESDHLPLDALLSVSKSSATSFLVWQFIEDTVDSPISDFLEKCVVIFNCHPPSKCLFGELQFVGGEGGVDVARLLAGPFYCFSNDVAIND